MSKVSEVLYWIAYDNCFNLRAHREWPTFINYKWLNEQLSQCTSRDLEILAMGEEKEAQLVKAVYCIDEDVNKFFNDVFDGPLHEYYFQ